MTSTHSGALMYEFSEESNNYGIVRIADQSLTEMSEFTSLKQMFEKVKVPSGDGGYRRHAVRPRQDGRLGSRIPARSCSQA